MILNLEATEFHGRTETGRSHPMLCTCEDASGELFDVYVKYVNFHDDLAPSHLVGELIANVLALDMGIPAATPCLVQIGEDFVDSIASEDTSGLVSVLSEAPVVAFGSLKISPVRRWETTDLVHRAQQREATLLYLFDTLVENSDRGLRNPNLLMSGDDFRVIDFGHSFQRCHDHNDSDAPPPWRPHGILNHMQGNMQHIMYRAARDADAIAEFTDMLKGLEDERLEDYLQMVPRAWDSETACRIVAYLLEARLHADDFTTQAKGVLR